MTLKFGLVGCGRIAQRHAQILGEGSHPGVKLVAVCDVNEERSTQLAAKFNVNRYRDMVEMAVQEKLDVCVILTPSGLHAEHTVKLAPHCRNIIVEKPMALTLADADAMIAACDRQSTRLFVVKQNRFNIPVQKARNALLHGDFGKLILGTVRVRWCRSQSYYDQDDWRGTWAMDGGVLANQASHHIDLLTWFFGDVKSVFARANTSLVQIEAEDTAIATVQFENGALGIIEATTAIRPTDLEGSLSIIGEKGNIEIGGFAVNKLLSWNFMQQDNHNQELQLTDYSENPPDVYGFGHRTYYNDTVDCILHSKKNLVDGLEGRKSLEVIIALYESIETGKEVFLKFQPGRCRLGMGKIGVN